MDRQVLTELLEMYHSYRCLWDHEQRDYLNRDIRNAAYEELLKKYKTINSDANMESLKKKIEYMRTCFRREYKKVQLSKKYAKGPDDVYRPSLWYYSLLVFLANEEILNKFGTPIQRSEYHERMNSPLQDSDAESPTVVHDAEENLLIKTEMTESIPETLEGHVYEAAQSVRHPFTPKKLKFDEKPSLLQAKLLQKNEEGQCQTFGKMIGLQLEGLDTNQQHIAQKLISDVIFYGRLRKLELSSSIQLNAPVPNYAVSSSKSVESDPLQPCASSTDRINYPLKIEASYELSNFEDSP